MKYKNIIIEPNIEKKQNDNVILDKRTNYIVKYDNNITNIQKLERYKDLIIAEKQNIYLELITNLKKNLVSQNHIIFTKLCQEYLKDDYKVYFYQLINELCEYSSKMNKLNIMILDELKSKKDNNIKLQRKNLE